MKINLEEMTIVLNGATEEISTLAKTISTKNLNQVVELLNETNNGLPRILKTRALRMVLNEFVMIAKELPITTELLHRLNWYTEYSDYQLSKLLNTLANCGDARFNANASIEKYKISLWTLVLVNADNLKITEDTINKLTSLDNSFANFDEYNALLNNCLYDYNGSIDVVPLNDFSRVLFKSSTVVELRELATGYEINVPKRLNRAQLLETIVERLKEDNKYDEAIEAKIKDMKVVSLQRFAKDNDIKASTELKKEAVIDFIVKAVENDKANLKTGSLVELIVLDEEHFEMKPQYIREIDSRYFYEFDEDGEIVSMSDAEDLKAQIELLKQQQTEDREKLAQLENGSETDESSVNDAYQKRVEELEKQIEILNNNQENLPVTSEDIVEGNVLTPEEAAARDAALESLKGWAEVPQYQEITEETIIITEEIIEGNVLSDDELAVLNERTALLIAELAALKTRTSDLEAKNTDLSEEELAVQEELNKELAAKEAELANKEAVVAGAMAAREAEAEKLLAEELLAAKEAELAAREAELEAREAGLRETTFGVDGINADQSIESEEVTFTTEEEPEFSAPKWDDVDIDTTPSEEAVDVEFHSVIKIDGESNEESLDYVDKFDNLEELTPVVVNQGVVNEVTFVGYEEQEEFTKSLIHNSVELNDDYSYGDIYNEIQTTGLDSTTGNVEYTADERKQKELEGQSSTIDHLTGEVISVENNSRISRLNEIDSLITILKQGEIKLDGKSGVAKNLNNFYGKDKNKENFDLDFEYEFEDEDTSIDFNFSKMNDKQKKAANKISKLKEKKSNLEAYKTMPDAKLVSKHRSMKRNRIIRRVLFVVLVVALYLLVSIGGVYAHANDSVIFAKWSFNPEGTFAQTNEKLINAITFSNYDKVASVFESVYKAIYGIFK